MLKEKDLPEAREKLHKMVDSADRDQLEKLISALHLGSTVNEMTESIAATKEAMPKMGMDPDEHEAVAMMMMRNKSSGDDFCITVRRASAGEIIEYTRQCKEAAPLPN
jgi:hypothetical protein